MTITGYRELTKTEIDTMNEIKEAAIKIGELVVKLQHTIQPGGFMPDQRWVSIGKTELQQGFMALSRAVAQPTTF
ncbi:MAG: hypothetical protein ACLP3R_25385 [Candidatus Korobacteraceae bacterium]